MSDTPKVLTQAVVTELEVEVDVQPPLPPPPRRKPWWYGFMFW